MSETSVSTRGTDLMGEALLFGLLGKALYEDLDKTWLETLVGEGVFAEAPFGAERTEVQVGLDFFSDGARHNAVLFLKPNSML